MGRTHQANIHRYCGLAAHPHDAALLQSPQQFDLHRGRHVANFVQEKRATIGLFEDTFFGPHRSGKRALFVAEQFGFEQALRERAAIHGNKGSGLVGMLMQCTGNALLADTGFTGDQHRRCAAAEPLHHAFNVQHRRRLPQTTRTRQKLRRNKSPNLLHQRIQVKRFGDVVLGAVLEQAHGGVNVALPGNEQERRQRQVLRQQLLEQSVAGDTR